MTYAVSVVNSMHIEFTAFFGSKEEAEGYVQRARAKGLEARLVE